MMFFIVCENLRIFPRESARNNILQTYYNLKNVTPGSPEIDNFTGSKMVKYGYNFIGRHGVLCFSRLF
jgi:hypothetical protein